MKKLFNRAAVLLLLFIAPFSACFAQGTAFTYQGRLNSSGSPANGNYDLKFTLFDTNQPVNNLIGGPVTNSATAVSNGLFLVTLDFGGVFIGSPRWLEIGVRTNGGGGFSTLTPRQPLTPSPYAIFAGTASNLIGTLASASVAGTYGNAVTLSNAANQISGTFTGNGANVANVNAATLNGVAASNLWQLGGNNVSSGQFLGSTNNQALELKVNGVRGLRLELNTNAAPNVIGGSPVNYVAPGLAGVVIAGGGTTNIGGAAYSNSVQASYANIGGGVGNSIEPGASLTTIGGGFFNDMQYATAGSVISGGSENLIQTNSDSAVIGGGQANGIHADAWGSVIAGGEFNHVYESAHQSVISGGNQNVIASNSIQSVIGGGTQNFIQNDLAGSTIGGGQSQTIGAGARSSTIAGGRQNLIQSNSYQSTISGGQGNRVESDAINSTISGGSQNFIRYDAYDGFIGGGELNVIQVQAALSTIAGGVANVVQTNSNGSAIGGGSGNIVQPNISYSTIAGGYGNTNTGALAMIPGGDFNVAGQNSFAAGHRAKALTSGAFVWADSQNADFSSTDINQFLVRAANGVGINTNNPQSALHVNGTVTATNFSGSGAGLSSLNASQLLSGTVPQSRLPAAVVTNNATGVVLGGTFTGTGSGLTGLNAGNISSGSLADARLSANVPLLSANQAFSGTNIFNARVGINTNNPGATLDVNGSLRVGNGTTIFNNLQAGLAQMATDSTTVKTNFTFTFPKAFGSVPNILVSGRADPLQNVDDTFTVSVRRVTTTNCTVNITRTDTAAGWGQHVQVTWMAWE